MAEREQLLQRIVVGTDGSEHATIALQWAAEEAKVHGATVQAVMVWSYLDQHHADHSTRFDPAYTEDEARATLTAWVNEALGSDDAVDQRVVCDLAPRALLDASDGADLLVVGARGTGGFEGLVLGSVSDRVVQQASRPVAVIRAPAPVAGGRVVVGIDGSERSRNALRWAAGEARARTADLDVVHGWRLPMIAAPTAVGAYPDLTMMEQTGQEILADARSDPALAGVRARSHLAKGSPAQALMDLSEGAGLLVVGTRGLGRVTGTLLGSVSRQLVHHAPCPVVVI